MKKILSTLALAALLAGCSSAPAATETTPAAETPAATETTAEVSEAAALPAPRDTSKMYTPGEGEEEVNCTENTYSTACSSIDQTNLTEYLGRDDVLYIDLRDYSDYAKKHLRNFECIPYFALVYNTEPSYQLYSGELTAPVATYEESDDLLEEFFPKDTTIFFMCQSGGRVSQLMQILEAKGYDMSKIYNVGGMGQYTDKAFDEWTVDSAEVVVDATYSFEGLTPVAE